MENEVKTYWLRKIVDFMHKVDQIEKADSKDLIKTTMGYLHSMSGAKQIHFIEKKDKVTAFVTHSIPEPANVTVIDPAFLNSVSGNQPHFPDAEEFPELRSLASDSSSIIILPLLEQTSQSCIVMLWDELVDANEAFKEFIYICFSVMRRVGRLTSVFNSIEQLKVHFNAILETIPQSVVFIDESGNISWVNKKASVLFNLPAGNVEPSLLSAAMLAFRNKADNRDEIFQRGMEFFQSGQKIVNEWKWIYSNPSLVLNVCCTPVISSNVKGMLWMFEDITERYYADKKIQDLNHKLQEASDYKSQFLANMSHELRTPLNSILVLANLLSENESGNLTEKQVNHAEIISRSGHDLLYLINDILDLSKIEAGKMDLHFEKESVKSIVQTMTDLFSAVSVSKAIAFNVTVSDRVPEMIVTDLHRLNQVLKNLLSNAFKFTRSGGNVEMRVDIDDARQNLLFSVKDTGIGVEESKKQEIFEAFKQANGSTTRNYGGTGLGLSISKELVWKFGGDITIESSPGKGSLFLVRLPLTEPEPLGENRDMPVLQQDEFPSFMPAEFDHLRNRRILIASEDVREIFSISSWLESVNLTSLPAMSAKEMLTHVSAASKLDIIIIDVSMENETALSLLQKNNIRNTSVIVLSSRPGDENIDLSPFSEGVILPKPVNYSRLLSAIRSFR